MTDGAPFDAATLDFYAAEAPVYAASGPGGASRHLAGFLSLLPAGARILELGCGGGRDAAAMIAAGFDVDATDGCPALALAAGERIGRPVRVMRFDELEADGTYDAIWAAASLLHVPRSGLRDVLARIRRALKPGGLHHASFKATGREGRDRYGRLFNQLTLAEVLAAYHAAGVWEVVNTVEYAGRGYDQQEMSWVAVTMRRP